MEDYKKMWDKLKNKLVRRIKDNIFYKKEIEMKYGYDCAITTIFEDMQEIESEYQPKQYTWMEIISFEKIPNQIKSEFGDYYVYIPSIKMYTLCKQNAFLLSANVKPPTIEEMKNKWTIVEE